MIGRLNHVAIAVKDLAAAADVYKKTLGAEVSAAVTENVFDELDAPVERVTGEDVPMPYARNLELLATPHEEQVIAAVKRVMYVNG